jgi:hypothetical protein
VILSPFFFGFSCLTLLLLLLGEAASAVRELTSEANLCGEINSLRPGETLTLAPGEYRGPCKIRHGGGPGVPIVIQAQNQREKPRIVYDGDDNNVFEIWADFVTLRGLRIGPTKRNVAGVRILARAGITIEDCEFSQLGGIAVAATRTSVDGLSVRRNVVTDSNATAMYFGCHDGIECQISNLIVERNFIKGVNATDPEIGYGIQIKLNSSGNIADNVVVDTKGPGIMVYGSSHTIGSSVIERNFVSGSRQSSGILIGGGPAQVRNNIVRYNVLGGIALQDYGSRGLLRQIAVVNNTSVNNDQGEFVVPPEAETHQILFALNAAVSSEQGLTLPRTRAGLDLRQNVDCSAKACFANPALLNFSPQPNGPLFRAGKIEEVQLPPDDYFGRRRMGRIIAGAVAFSGPSVRIGLKVAH